MTANPEKLYEAIISSAYMFKTQGAYGSFEKAMTALMKRKPIIAADMDRNKCEEYFRIALKVVDDALEFEKTYVRSNQVKKTSSGWVDRETILEISQKMEAHLKDKNPGAPPIFIERSIGRISYYYHLS